MMRLHDVRQTRPDSTYNPEQQHVGTRRQLLRFLNKTFDTFLF